MGHVAGIRALRPIGAGGFGVGAGAFVERCQVRLRDRKESQRVQLRPHFW